MKKLFALLLILATVATMSCKKDDTTPDEPKVVAVTGVTLNKTTLDLLVAGKETLTATVTPENATNKAIKWESDKTAIATVSEAGVVTAVAAGTAVISAIAVADNTKKGQCTVTVVEMSPSEYTDAVENAAGVVPTAGDGTEANPYLIASASNMKWLKGQVGIQTEGKYYKLTTNLNITAATWEPSNNFVGHFDGDNHTISGKLTPNESLTSRFGFFGEIEGAATIKNLHSTAEVYAPKTRETGAIAGYFTCFELPFGSITNCTNTGKITGLTAVGGILGATHYACTTPSETVHAFLADCSNSGEIVSTAAADNVSGEGAGIGGIIGSAYLDPGKKPTTDQKIKFIIKNCANSGKVTLPVLVDNAFVGGIIGTSNVIYATLNINGCTNTGKVICGTTEATTAAGAEPYYFGLIYGGNAYSQAVFTFVTID